jgi:hypothetical protein
VTEPTTDSIPPGLRVRFARAQIRPGMETEAERWMQMLNDRHDDAVQTLERERMAIEIIFRERDKQGDWLIWIMVHGDAGEPVETSPFDLDHAHIAFEDRVLLADQPEAEPELLLMPAPVRRAVLAWALQPGA